MTSGELQLEPYYNRKSLPAAETRVMCQTEQPREGTPGSVGGGRQEIRKERRQIAFSCMHDKLHIGCCKNQSRASRETILTPLRPARFQHLPDCEQQAAGGYLTDSATRRRTTSRSAYLVAMAIAWRRCLASQCMCPTTSRCFSVGYCGNVCFVISFEFLRVCCTALQREHVAPLTANAVIVAVFWTQE